MLLIKVFLLLSFLRRPKLAKGESDLENSMI